MKVCFFSLLYLFINLNTGELWASPRCGSSSGASITLRFEDKHVEDTLKMYYSDHIFTTDSKFFDKEIILVKNSSGKYHFRLQDIDTFFYIRIVKIGKGMGEEEILPLFLASLSDSIEMSVIRKMKDSRDWFSTPYCLKYGFSFEGKGKEKYRCRYDFDRKVSENKISGVILFDSSGQLVQDGRLKHYQILARQILRKYQNGLTANTYKILQLDFFAEISYISLLHAFQTYKFSYAEDSSDIRILENFYSDKLNQIVVHSNPNIQEFSMNYILFLYEIFSIGKQNGGSLKRIKEDYILNVYAKIGTIENKGLKDKLLTYFAIQVNDYSRSAQNILDDALKNVKTEYYSNLLGEFSARNSLGSPGYNFSLPNTAGQIVRLEDFAGKIVFIDYWFTGCYNCAEYYRKVLSKVEKRFHGRKDIAFVTISVDIDKARWINSVKSGLYTSEESAINLFTEGDGPQHPATKNYGITLYPSHLIIGKRGQLLVRNVSEIRSKSDDELYEFLIELIKKDN